MELGVFTGFIAPDKRLIATPDPGIEPVLGVRLGAGINRSWNWFAEAQTAQFETQTFAGDAKMLAARGGVEWLIEPGGRAEPFVSMGWGYINMTFDGATDFLSAFDKLSFSLIEPNLARHIKGFRHPDIQIPVPVQIP